MTSDDEAELDRRHPERVQVRTMVTADDHRATWTTIEGLWSTTIDRARRLPEATLHERVDDEWSFVETLRHLVFATDVWLARTLGDEPRPVHALGLPHSSYPDDLARSIGVDRAARPTLDEVLAARSEAVALGRSTLAGLTDAALPRRCPRIPAPGYGEEPPTVHECLWTVMEEECEHHRYATRDLTVLLAAG